LRTGRKNDVHEEFVKEAARFKIKKCFDKADDNHSAIKARDLALELLSGGV
jgi:hypothetical protein